MNFFRLVLFSLFACGIMISPALAAEKKEASGGSEFVKLDPLIFPIIDTDGVQQVVNLVVTLEVGTLKEADKIKAMQPRLTDAYIEDMYGILYEHAALRGGVIQITMIKKRLNRITNDIMGDDAHAKVLLQHVQQRPI